MDRSISLQAAIDAMNRISDSICEQQAIDALCELPSAHPDVPDTNVGDTISKQAAIRLITGYNGVVDKSVAKRLIAQLPSAQPEQRYTEEELRVFQHGISLSLLSKRSAQYWQYDEDTATEIKFLERLYEKVSADMRGEDA